MAAHRLFRPLLLSALALASGLGCTNAYLQNEGPYVFTATEVIRDDCGLLAASSVQDSWDSGELIITGDVVRMNYELMDMQLIGAFLEGGLTEDDGFMLDGSVANAPLSAKGTQCTVDQVAVHLEATTRCATQFDGVLRVRYEPRVEQPECACQVWMRYQAVQNARPCILPAPAP
ncbi:MAG TPA: hypothetical protein VFZ09_34910 [Archangium sp.]|uniref:hypothetical protein n=1 Tax=Archangium sp. TaxID=1872627 RepID=UPI002E315264|nr:hypothetical protein [Archangium sp.]HEX5751466.1 hypothetical protein [Archangium sp.]